MKSISITKRLNRLKAIPKYLLVGYRALQGILVTLRLYLDKVVIDTKYYPMTQLLLLVNLIVFILQLHYRPFTAMFALDSSIWYTYITSCFLHANVPHLVGNMIVLSIIAPVLERNYSSKFLGLATLLTGISGSLLFAYFIPMGSYIGASGITRGLAMLWVIHNLINKRILLIVPVLFGVMMQGVSSGISLIKPDGIGYLVHYGSALGALFLLPIIVNKHIKELK